MRNVDFNVCYTKSFLRRRQYQDGPTLIFSEEFFQRDMQMQITRGKGGQDFLGLAGLSGLQGL